MTIDLTDTTTSAIHDALRQARLRLGGVASGDGAHAGHRDR